MERSSDRSRNNGSGSSAMLDWLIRWSWPSVRAGRDEITWHKLLISYRLLEEYCKRQRTKTLDSKYEDCERRL